VSPRGSFVTFLGLASLGVALVVLFSRVAPEEPRQPFALPLKKHLEKLDPEIVMVGNSMLNSRFTEGELGRLIAPKRVALVAVGGSKSAFWYLALKNVILPVTRPKEIIIFYRRRELTTPRDRVLGADHHRLDRVTPKDDPFVEEMIAPQWDEPVERLGWVLGRLVPVGRLHALVSPHLDDFAASTATLLGGETRRARSKQALETVFSLGKLRSSDIEPAAGEEKELLKFHEALPRSFLPSIVALAKGAGAKLTFVKVRTRADATTTTRRRRRAGTYADELERYFRENGADHLDLTGNEWETISLYGEGDHLNKKYRDRYMRLFLRHHRDLFD
jgi:hypothetical protein